MANFKVEPNKGDTGKTNVKVTSEVTNNETSNRTLGSVIFTTEDGTQKSVRVFQYGKTVFEVDRPNPMASTDTQVSFTVHSWYHGAYSPINVYTPVGTASAGLPVGGDVRVTISGIPQNPGSTTKTYNVVLTQDSTGNTITLPIIHTAEEQPVPVVHTFSVSPASLSLEEGELSRITCLYDDEALSPTLVSFTSTNNAILTVDASGTVTAVKEGIANIEVVYNNTDPTDGNVYTATIPAIIRTAQVVPTTCSIVFDITPAGATVTINGAPLTGYTYTALIGTPFTYEISKPGYISVSNTFTPTKNETISVTLSEKVVTGITKLTGGTELSYPVVSAAGVTTDFYPNNFNIPFKVLYNNNTEEIGFYVAGTLVNNQWSIQKNLPIGLGCEFVLTPDSSISGINFSQTSGVFTTIPENINFTQRVIGTVNLNITGQLTQSISQAQVNQLESTEKVISSITVGTSGRIVLSYPNVSALGDTVLPNHYHLPLIVSYTNGTIDSTTYYLDNTSHNLPDGVVARFTLGSTNLPNTGSVVVEENPRTSTRSIGPVNLSVLYSGNTTIIGSASIDQTASTFTVTGGNIMNVGSTTQLTATFNGTDVTSTASWVTSNSSLATVSSGLVTALDDGNVTITANYKESSESKAITIQQALTLVVTEQQGRSRFKIGEDTHFTLIVRKSNGESVSTPTFTHDGEPGDVTFDDNHVVFNTPGTYTITASDNGLTGTIQFSAVELVSLTLTSEATILSYGIGSRFHVTGLYSDDVEENLDGIPTLQVVDGGQYCSIASGVLINTNAADTHSYNNVDVYALATDIQDGSREIRGTFTGIPDDAFSVCYSLLDVFSGTYHNASVKASYLGIDSNTVTIGLYPQSASGTRRTGVFGVNDIVIADTTVAVVSASGGTAPGGVVTLQDLNGSEGTTTLTASYEGEEIGTLTIRNIPEALYLSTDALGQTHAIDMSIYPNVTTTAALFVYNLTSLSRKFKVSDTGFRRWNSVPGQTADYDHITTNGTTAYTAIVRPSDSYNGSPLTLSIPTANAISVCTSTYNLYRFIQNTSVVANSGNPVDSIVITEQALGVSDIDITSFWYLPINVGDQYSYPKYTIDVTYMDNQVITFNQDSFDTDFFSHTPANSILVGIVLDFMKNATYPPGIGTVVNHDTGVVTLPGTATERLAEIVFSCNSVSADSKHDYAYAIVGESIKLDFKDQFGNDVVDRDNTGTPDYWIAKNLTVGTDGDINSQGVTRFKVYHNGDDVTAQCTYQITNTSHISGGINPTVSLADGYVCVTMTNQTGYCTLSATYQDPVWSTTKDIELHFAQQARLGSDYHVQWYSLESPINLGGSFQEAPVHLWADFTGTLTDMVYDGYGTLPASTPVAMTRQDTATRAIVKQFNAGRCTAYLDYKNLRVEAAVISQ